MTARILPTPARAQIKGVVFRRLTLKERFKLILGYSMLIEITVACQHMPGKTQPHANIHLTPEKHGVQAHARFIKEQRAEADADKAKLEGGL
jgi:diadenosine tetraphosphate (Ap4A) HIT family hydrolase